VARRAFTPSMISMTSCGSAEWRPSGQHSASSADDHDEVERTKIMLWVRARDQRRSLLRANSVEKILAAVEAKFLRAADAFNAVRHGGPHRLEQTLRLPSSHEERILRRNLPPASFCKDFALAAFSIFSTESRRQTQAPKCWITRDKSHRRPASPSGKG
jgi:hypothetical protein